MLGKCCERSFCWGDEDVFGCVKRFFIISLKVISECSGFSAQFPWKGGMKIQFRSIRRWAEFFPSKAPRDEQRKNLKRLFGLSLRINSFQFVRLDEDETFFLGASPIERRCVERAKGDLSDMFMTLKHYCIIIIVIIVCSLILFLLLPSQVKEGEERLQMILILLSQDVFFLYAFVCSIVVRVVDTCRKTFGAATVSM